MRRVVVKTFHFIFAITDRSEMEALRAKLNNRLDSIVLEVRRNYFIEVAIAFVVNYSEEETAWGISD